MCVCMGVCRGAENKGEGEYRDARESFGMDGDPDLRKEQPAKRSFTKKRKKAKFQKKVWR